MSPHSMSAASPLGNAFNLPGSGKRAALAGCGGDFDTAVIYTGEAIDMIHAIKPAAVIVRRVVTEAEATLARRFD
jgi:hypothetical protein